MDKGDCSKAERTDMIIQNEQYHAHNQRMMIATGNQKVTPPLRLLV